MNDRRIGYHFLPAGAEKVKSLNLDPVDRAVGTFRDVTHDVASAGDEADRVLLIDAIRLWAPEASSDIVHVLAGGIDRRLRVYVSSRGNPRDVFRAIESIVSAIEATLLAGKTDTVLQLCNSLCGLFNPLDDVSGISSRDVLRIWPFRPFLGRLSFAFLACGDLGNGWLYYTATKDRGLRENENPFPQPFWNGEPLRNQRIVVWRNHGPGDEILYAEMLPDLISGAKQVLIETDPRLVNLFARSFPEATVFPRCPEPYGPEFLALADYQVTHGGLAAHFRHSFQEFGRTLGYLRADRALVSEWKTKLRSDGFTGPLVGLVWRSGKQNADARYNTEIEEWRPIFSVTGIRFVPLLYDEHADELEIISKKTTVDILEPASLDMLNEIDGQAALIDALDLVIGVNTLATNLAGALGVRCWELGPWWLHFYLGRASNPWFPNTRLSVQDAGVSTTDLLSGLADDLGEFRLAY
jgi:hypothetical protein